MKNSIYSLIIVILYPLYVFPAFADCTKTVVIVRHGEVDFNAPYGQLDCQGLNRSLALSSVLRSQYGKPAAIYASNPNVTIHYNGQCYPYIRPMATLEPTAAYYDMSINVAYGVGDYQGPSSPYDPTVNSAADIPTVWQLSLPQLPTPLGQCGIGRSSSDIDLAREILKRNDFCGKTIFVAWEHDNIPIVAYSFYYLLGIDPTNKISLWPFGECLASYASLGYCSSGTWSPYFNFDTEYVLQINQSTTPPTIEIVLRNENLNNQPTSCPS